MEEEALWFLEEQEGAGGTGGAGHMFRGKEAHCSAAPRGKPRRAARVSRSELPAR